MRVKRTAQFLIFVHSDWGEMNLMVVFLSISELAKILNALKRYFLVISISSFENSAQICSYCLLWSFAFLTLGFEFSVQSVEQSSLRRVTGDDSPALCGLSPHSADLSGAQKPLVYVTCCPSFLSEWDRIQKVLPAPVSVGHHLCSLFQQFQCFRSKLRVFILLELISVQSPVDDIPGDS